ncbi:hypothetical protein A0J51_00963 [Gluconobacter japonicus]|nr:hypothetical protein A0J51_00963 [Gluconobacter japonicus]
MTIESAPPKLRQITRRALSSVRNISGNFYRKYREKDKKKQIEEIAGNIRDYSQYLIAALIFFSLAVRVFVRFDAYHGPSIDDIKNNFPANASDFHLMHANLVWFLSQNTLSIIGDGLALSAGVDLAYMLFTPGPDEVIAPLLTALSATIVLIISNDEKLDLNLIIGVFVLILGMILLLLTGFLTGLIDTPDENKKNNLVLLFAKKKLGLNIDEDLKH